MSSGIEEISVCSAIPSNDSAFAQVAPHLCANDVADCISIAAINVLISTRMPVQFQKIVEISVRRVGRHIHRL